jgi:hypothetical protein
MIMLLRILAVCLILAVLSVGNVSASCVCRCVNGQMVPLCSSTIEIPPICPPTICGIVPPSIQPIPRPMIPPIGTTSCAPQQVMNPYTRQYEWRTICR